MTTPLMMIINPAAGKGGYANGLPLALKMLSDAGYKVTVFFTQRRGHATELAARHAGEYEKLIVLGGDGTLAEVMAGLMQLQKRPQVGYIPIGTANDIARTLGLPKNEIAVCTRRFLEGSPLPFDTGKINDGYFNYVAAFGAFTEVSYATPQDAKQQFGQAAYIVAALNSLGTSLKSRHVRVEFDGGELDGEFLYGGVSNTYSVGGTIALPREQIELGDGEHELILLKKLPSAAAALPLAAQVLNHNFSSEYIIIEHTKKAVFYFDEPEAWTFDGEDGGAHSTVRFENCPHAVDIIC